MNKFSIPQTATQRTFSYYTKYISNKIIKKYGPTLSNYEDIKNEWRYSVPFSKEIEEYIILKTRVYIITLDSRNPNYTNPDFLKSLIRSISDYLSVYTMRSDEMQNRKKAKEILKLKLYDEFQYIKNMIERQAYKREKQSNAIRNQYKRPSHKKQQVQNAQKSVKQAILVASTNSKIR